MDAFDPAPELSALLLIDMQERFLPAIPGIGPDGPAGCACRRLLAAARLLGVPVLASEQYPRGLGPTLPHLAEALGDAPRLPKTAFSCCDDAGLARAIEALDRPWWVLAGIEAHVCVLTTALDLAARGRRVAIAADAVASRRGEDREQALAAARAAGLWVLPSETLIFRWLRDAAHPAFKAVSALLR